MMVRWLVVIAMLVGCQAPAEAETFTFSKDRVVKLIGEVSGDSLTLAQEIDKLSLISNKPIDFLINSPGGAVGPGMTVVDSMRQAQKRGVRFRCVTGVLAASMAFIILAECDERYTLPNARLLFHPISISTNGARVGELLTVLKQIVEQEERVKSRLQSQMGMSTKDFIDNYYAETFWSGYELTDFTKNKSFLTVVDQVTGAGPELFRYRTEGFVMFGQIEREIIERYEGLNK